MKKAGHVMVYTECCHLRGHTHFRKQMVKAFAWGQGWGWEVFLLPTLSPAPFTFSAVKGQTWTNVDKRDWSKELTMDSKRKTK